MIIFVIIILGGLAFIVICKRCIRTLNIDPLFGYL